MGQVYGDYDPGLAQGQWYPALATDGGGYWGDDFDGVPDYSPPAGIRGFALAAIFVCIGLLSYWGDASLAAYFAPLSQCLVAGLAIVLIFGVFSSGASVVFSAECILWLLFFLWGLVGYPFALSTVLAQEGLITLAKLLLTGLVVANAVNGRRAFLWLLVAVIMAGVLASLGGATGMARGAEEAGYGTARAARSAGLFGNPNGLGKLMCLGIWAAVVIMFSSRSKTLKMFMVAEMLLCVVVIGATGSRQAMVGIALLGLSTYWFLLRKTSQGMGQKTAWLIVMAGLVLCAILYLTTTAHWERMARLFEEEKGVDTESSAQARKQYLIGSWTVALKNPLLGVGYDCMSLSLGQSGMHSPHNSILGVAGNTGFIGWMLFFGAWGLIFRRMHRLGKFTLPAPDRVILLSGWLLELLLLFWSFVTVLTNYKPFWVLQGAYLGYLIYLERTYAPKASRG